MYSSAHRGQRSDSPNSLKLELQVIMIDIEAGIQLASSRRAVCTLDHRANSLGLDLSLNCMWVWEFCDVPSQSLKKPLKKLKSFPQGRQAEAGWLKLSREFNRKS